VVMGKRGNSVEVYPGVMYDFMPNILTIKTDEYVHIHWTGSNTNPLNNERNFGLLGTDRSNLVPVADLGKSYPQNVNETNLFNGDLFFLDRFATLGPIASSLDNASPSYDLAKVFFPLSPSFFFLRSLSPSPLNHNHSGS